VQKENVEKVAFCSFEVFVSFKALPGLTGLKKDSEIKDAIGF
jgi:hypothetical protein